MENPQNSILKRLCEARFLAAGETAIIKHLEDLLERVKTCDFTSDEEAAAAERTSLLLNNDIFPGATAKAMTPIEYSPGKTIKGKISEYRQAHIVFWTLAGIIEIPFCCLDEDLQRCFPNDPGVFAATQARALTKKLKEETERIKAEGSERLKQLEEVAEGITRLIQQNELLQTEAADLKNKIIELEGGK